MHISCPQKSSLFTYKITNHLFAVDRKSGSSPPLCGKSQDLESPYYRPLQGCIGGTQSQRWIPIEEKTKWPARARLSSKELAVHGNNLYIKIDGFL